VFRFGQVRLSFPCLLALALPYLGGCRIEIDARLNDCRANNRK